jgi:hypothetical protein
MTRKYSARLVDRDAHTSSLALKRRVRHALPISPAQHRSCQPQRRVAYLPIRGKAPAALADESMHDRHDALPLHGSHRLN